MRCILEKCDRLLRRTGWAYCVPCFIAEYLSGRIVKIPGTRRQQFVLWAMQGRATTGNVMPCVHWQAPIVNVGKQKWGAYVTVSRQTSVPKPFELCPVPRLSDLDIGNKAKDKLEYQHTSTRDPVYYCHRRSLSGVRSLRGRNATERLLFLVVYLGFPKPRK